MSFLGFSFKHPTSLQIFGPTQCGKTRLVLRILEHQVIRPFPTRINRVFSEPQQYYNEAARFYSHIVFEHKWRDNIYDRITPDTTNLLIVADQLEEAESSKSVQNLFTKT